jgi:flagellin
MSLVVTHNLAAINTNRNLYSTNNSLNKSLEKLSSGYRINVGADGPADLVISEQLRAQTTGLERAVRNTTEAINVLSITEGALNEMNSILKDMKALAVHAANNGITSPEQVEADQAELDSGIATLNRIANATKYSDQFLLNGSKDLTYNVSTEIKGTQNNTLVDSGSSEFTQIFKRDGFSVTIGFSGTKNADEKTYIGDASMTNQAAKAYLEIDTTEDSISQVDENGNLTQSQSFILTGSLGSKQFTFGEGTSISQVVSAISNYSGSTGIDAALTFNTDQKINQTVATASADVSSYANATTIGITSKRAVGDLVMFDNYTTDSSGDLKLLVNKLDTALAGVHYGYNTDGQGRIYIKITGDDTYELYKDESLSEESLVGSGTSGSAMVEQNHSGLADLKITLSGDGKYGDVAYISTGNISLDEENVSYSGIMVDETDAQSASAAANNTFAMSTSIASGVQLGINTSSDGKIYTKVVVDNAGKATVYAYKDAAMRDEDLVAKSTDDIDLSSADAVILNAAWNDERTASTGLALHLNLNDSAAENFEDEGTYDGSITFSNLGARVYTTEYGSDALLQVQQLEGGIFTYYDQPGKASSATLIEAGGTGTTYSATGQDATINVNGEQMKTSGLTLNLSTADVTAKIVFNEGKTGSTTIAQVGYGEGSVFTKNTSLTLTYEAADSGYYSAMLNNANHNTNETINHFQGGMQLQLGEGSGDQERTVIAVKSMAVENMGRVKVTAQFDPDSAVIETRTLSLSDVQGGQIASLSQNAELSMKIIEQAITDVSNLRAQIGAVQSNMLQTNENNLQVAIENITKTESNIRDTDMASEMTEYTTQQVLASAGISMLTQANTNAQNVLTLLR